VLPVIVPHDEIRFAFLDGPGRLEAVGGHSQLLITLAHCGTAASILRCYVGELK
jgi:hypothetical protein